MIPQAKDIEESVLGLAITNQQACTTVLSKLSDQDFTDGNVILFKAIRTLFNEDAPLGGSALKGYIEENDLQIGKPVVDHVIDKASGVKADGIETACQYLKKYTKRRSLIDLCREYNNKAKDRNEDTEDLLAEAGTEFFDLLSDDEKDSETGFIDAIEKTAQEVQEPIQHGIKTDLDLDKITLGFKPKQLIVIAGKTSHGKSSFAQNVMLTAAEKYGHVGFVSMEMSRSEIMERIFSMYAGVKLSDISERKMSQEQIDTILHKKEQMKKFKHGFTIVDNGTIEINKLYATARRLKMQKDIRLLIVDYLQQIESDGNTREQEVAKISRTLKKIAMDLDIAVIALSQFNRQASQSHITRPQLHHLRESGAIEQDANTAILLWNPSVDGIDNFPDGDNPKWAGKSTQNIVELHVAKNRGGKTGTVKVGFDGEVQRFYNLAPESAMDYL